MHAEQNARLKPATPAAGQEADARTEATVVRLSRATTERNVMAEAKPNAAAALAPRLNNRALRVFLGNRLAVASLILLGFIGLVALLAPYMFPGDPMSVRAPANIWPLTDWRYPLGTDTLGRDVLAGLAHGGRVSLMVGIVATLLAAGLGLVVGALAGYFGGVTDTVLSRIIEIFQTLPNFVLLIVLVAITSMSLPMIIVAIALITWPTIGRLTRAEFRKVKEAEFVTAARSLGYSQTRIIFSEILPNAAPAIIVTASVMTASAILLESALSFMGFGDPNAISWGAMIGAGREALRTGWYLTAIPGLAIVVTVLAINLLGDALNDALNPRFMEGRQ
jgi:peptide/nickel transport system permease protein